jgi:murein peptide amidase A
MKPNRIGLVVAVVVVVAVAASAPATAREDTPIGTAAPGRVAFLDFLFTPRRPGNLVARLGIAGHSADGRAIRVRQWGDPARPAVLVFGCVHGDECAAHRLEPRFVLSGGCPDPGADLVVVPNLDPDGMRAGTRLNADGVDLNRNFAAAWRPLGRPGDPQYSGPRPFSEPESRLAAAIVRTVAPRVTIWFHQHSGPRAFVRGWGQSAPAGRRFARLAAIPFQLLPWSDGTAPNWQNHTFPGTASFVVELPPGPLAPALAARLGAAEARLAHRVGEDGHVAKR